MTEPNHPSPGDVCVGCVHRPDPHNCRYFYLTEVLPFTRPDGGKDAARWMLLCERCYQLEGGDTPSALKQGLIPIGCDMQWPEGLRVDIKPPVVN